MTREREKIKGREKKEKKMRKIEINKQRYKRSKK